MTTKDKAAVKAALLAATGLKQGAKPEQEFLNELMRKVSALDEKDWDGLPAAAQAWYNDATIDHEAKRQLESLDDLPAAAAAPSRRKVADEAPAEPAAPKVGDEVKVKKGGRAYTGTVIEFDDKNLVLDIGGGEEEVYRRSAIESIEVVSSNEAAPPAKEPGVDDRVEVTLKDGEIIRGTITEIDDKNLVVDTGKEEEVYRRTRVASIAHLDTNAAKPEAAAKAEPAAKVSKPAAAPAAKAVTVSAREAVCENPALTMDQVAAKLLKDGVDIKPATLSIVYSDAQKVITLLRLNGLMPR